MRLPDYEHAPGRHCGSTTLRNLSNVYGWGFDEPTCFGLASGLGFTYFEFPESPHRGFFGRPVYLERAFVRTLGIEHVEREGDCWETAWKAVTDHLDAGRPVVLFVDIYDVDYFGTDTHFAPHAVLAVGYDDEHVLLSDSEFPEPQRLPLDSLRAAWDCTPVLPMRNRFLAVTDSEITTPFEDTVREATLTMAHSMLDPHGRRYDPGPVGHHGIDGIRALAAGMPEWPSLPEPSWTTRFAYQNVERRGTGGGAFRGLQRDFFETVEHPFGDDVTERMGEIAADWTDVGQTLKDASEADADGLRDGLERAATEIGALADREEALYRDIVEIR